ncbi:MAG: tellurite resistance TerB family protein [Endomicrobia bacterium]|nr:tellurite resistance TerB family protein [Endomicrobiia bacterium]
MKKKIGCSYGKSKSSTISTIEDAIMALAILAVSSDGRINKKEVEMLERMISFSPLFRGVKSIDSYIECVYNIVLQKTRDEVIKESISIIPENLRPTLYGWLYIMIKSDKGISQLEHKFLDEIFKNLNINGTLAGKIKAVCEILIRKT